MPETKMIDLRLVAEIVGSYVSGNSIAAGELANLIAIVHRSLAELGKPADMPAPTPAVAINRSHGRDFVVCLDCGWRGQFLRRHLTARHGLSPHDYRARWNLRNRHPLTAPAYSERRSTLAKQLGLGQGGRPRAATPVQHPNHRHKPPSAAVDPAEQPLTKASGTQSPQSRRPRRRPATVTSPASGFRRLAIQNSSPRHLIFEAGNPTIWRIRAELCGYLT